MPIVGLKLSPFYSRESWILEENAQLRNREQVSEPERHYLKNLHDIAHYSWTLKEYIRTKSRDLSTTSDVSGAISQEIRDRISRVLIENVEKWKIASTSSFLGINRMQLLLLKSIAYSIFSNIIGSLHGSNLRGNHGFLIISTQEDQLYQWCLGFCKSAFWVDYAPEFDSDPPIYTIRLSDYLSPYKGARWWYKDGGYLGSCCCNICVYISKRLKDSHNTSSNIIIENIICKENKLLLQFLKHNRRWPTLEHKLLSITLDGFMVQKNITICSGSVNKSIDNVPHVFKNSGIFVICKDFDMFVEGFNAENATDIGSLLFDLIVEYTELWNKLNLPIFLFILYQDMELRTLHRDPNIGGKSNSLMNKAISLISHMSYVQFNYHLISGISLEECIVYRCLDESLNIIGKLAGDSAFKKSDSQNMTCCNLIKTIQGYTVEEFNVLVRHMKCEMFKFISSGQPTNVEMQGLSWFQSMLQKAISLRPPIHLLGYMPPAYRIYHKTTFPVSDEILPIEIDSLGDVKYKQGLSGVILADEVYHRVNLFLDETVDVNTTLGLVIEGSPGSGKTTLAMAIAWELGGMFIIANILDFIRPQVGFSEKLIHNFFHSIQLQFNSYSNYGTRRTSTMCTVLLEGLETLTNIEAGYIKRIISAISMELDSFAMNSKFLSNHSVLFICTANRASDIPRTLKSDGMFDCTLTLDSGFLDSSLLSRCLELYLNGRCDCMDKIDDIAARIISYRCKNPVNPAMVAKICKEAAYRNIKTWDGRSRPAITLSDMFNVIDSTFA